VHLRHSSCYICLSSYPEQRFEQTKISALLVLKEWGGKVGRLSTQLTAAGRAGRVWRVCPEFMTPALGRQGSRLVRVGASQTLIHYSFIHALLPFYVLKSFSFLLANDVRVNSAAFFKPISGAVWGKAWMVWCFFGTLQYLHAIALPPPSPGQSPSQRLDRSPLRATNINKILSPPRFRSCSEPALSSQSSIIPPNHITKTHQTAHHYSNHHGCCEGRNISWQWRGLP